MKSRAKKALQSIAAAAALPLVLGACFQQGNSTAPSACFAPDPAVASGLTGSGYVYKPDPMSSAGDATLAPTSLKLDQYRALASLEHLSGQGVLAGAYVDVRDGNTCPDSHLAFDDHNRFLYSHSDRRFQEAMAYSFGDNYRSHLDDIGYLAPPSAVKIYAHCMQQDNAYYVREPNPDGSWNEKVCLGDSVQTVGAYYADDAQVVVHELEHATTVDTYSLVDDINQFYYDEAGSLNEAISDYMALGFTEPLLPVSFDPRVFSRWALGTYTYSSNTRGAHRCPAYDSAFPSCSNFRSDVTGFSAANGTISYSYPDGLGWPYPASFGTYASQAFQDYSAQQEIHNAGILMVGALWDVQEALSAQHGGDEATAYGLTSKLILESLKHLPKPTVSSLSPITFRGFAQELVAATTLLGWGSGDQAAVTQALTQRGLLDQTNLVEQGWASAGPGQPETPGMRVYDNPIELNTWLGMMNAVPQATNTGTNHVLNPGEIAVILFDIANSSAHTAAGILLDVQIQGVNASDPEIQFLGLGVNSGYLSPTEAQVMYGKINGSAIVSALSTPSPTTNVPTGTTYFASDYAVGHPERFSQFFPRTGLWVMTKAGIATPMSFRFHIQAEPSNGASVAFDVPATIY